MWVSSGGGGGEGVGGYGDQFWPMFRVMTFKRPVMTFKASEYLLIINFLYLVPISYLF